MNDAEIHVQIPTRGVPAPVEYVRSMVSPGISRRGACTLQSRAIEYVHTALIAFPFASIAEL